MSFKKKTSKAFTGKKNRHKNRDEHDSQSEDEPAQTGNEYDIEASDDEFEEQTSKWFDEFPYVKLPKRECSEEQANSLKQEAEVILSDETMNFKAYLERSKKSETKWMMTMAKSGTSTDKVAALALMVQESPVHNVYALSSLVNMTKTSKKHLFMTVLDTLTELFITDLLRPSKKLRRFEQQPLAHLDELCGDDNALRRKRLCHWLFEDKLKSLYQQFVASLNSAAQDTVQNNREKAISALLKLVLENREQEDEIISNLINKFGDPVHKVASRVVYGLEKIVHKHPEMKENILDEVEKMLFRSHISKRAQYYGICFLSQYRFGSGCRELCKRLITLYFSFFKACVKTGDIDSRLMGALLVGVNRAYPYASRNKKESVIPIEHIDTMYKVVHYAPFKIGLQALALLLQVSNNDRFYNALYRKVFDKELCQTSHQAIWLNLMAKAIRKDENVNRRKAFVKRILQVCLFFPVPLLCGTLAMISQVVKQLPDTLENLEFCEVKNEAGEATTSQEMPNVVSNLQRFDGDDDEERVFDAKSEDEVKESNEEVNEGNPSSSQKLVGSSWYFREWEAPPKTEQAPVEKKFAPRTTYDPNARNPAFAGGEKAVFVELLELTKHFHPTVALFSRKILAGERIHYTGDPLKDFTTLHFLERFSFRNPKKAKTDRGPDRQELFRMVGSERSHYNPTGMRALPVQSDYYLKQQESAVPVDELFLYKYLKGKRNEMEVRQKKQKRETEGSDDESDLSDVDSVGSAEFNDYLDNLMTGKKSAETLNFADDVENTKLNKKLKKNKRKGDDEEDDDDEEDEDEGETEEEEDDIEEEEEDEEGDEDDDNGNDSEDFDENNIDLSASEDDEEISNLPLQTALRKRISRDFGNMAVPVEKFSEMLEETGRSKSGTSHAILNMDNASDKQLKWEASRMKQRWRNQGGPPNKRGRGGASSNNRKTKNTNNAKRKWNDNPKWDRNNKKRKHM